ncbi:MAG: hypothetical protein INQ03_00270 [Candidatus Heimdallarchaeota archaeon]|nr:hypothetical protein [Candidatus Heimdallarchaeota archaeon]
MSHLSRVSFTVYVYITEDIALVETCLKHCLPEELRSTPIQRVDTQSQFKDKLTILSIVLERKKEMDHIIPYLREHLENKEYITDNFDHMLDADSNILHFRIDKFKALDNVLEVTTGSDVIKCQISVTSYNQQDGCYDEVKKLFHSSGLIV